MLQHIHMHSHCLPDGRLWSVAGLTGMSSKGHLSWLAIQPAIKPLPATLCFLISGKGSIKPSVWTETCIQRVNSGYKELFFNRTQDGLTIITKVLYSNEITMLKRNLSLLQLE